jgi:Tol biopolymer transport system component/DNA-binding winged helix-turn-helix (wHTH) protein
MKNPGDGPTEIDLAHEPGFRLGRLEILPATREVAAPGVREIIEPRVMQALVCLAQANGAVVSRDDLVQRCWGGRIVSEDAINRCIAKVRKVAELESEPSFLVETVARVGYRLISSALPSQERPLLPPETNKVTLKPTAGVRRSVWPLLIAAICVASAAALAAWHYWPRPKWSVESSRPFVESLALEGQPAFSPDGAMMAYVSGTDTVSRKIYVRSVAGGDPTKITSDEFDDNSPSWASDGARVAYIAEKHGERCHIMVTTFPAGVAREVARCNYSDSTAVSWQAGTENLYFVERTPQGVEAVFRLSLDTGVRVEILREEKVSDVIQETHVSPDGKQLLYLVGKSFDICRMLIRDLGSGREKVLATVRHKERATWTSDNRTILTLDTVGVGSSIWAYPLSGSSPYRLYVTAANIVDLAAGEGGVLAVETDVGRYNLARGQTTPNTSADIVDAASGSTWSPTFAPDGTLAFLSNRSGENAVWTLKPGAKPVQLLGGGTEALIRLRWSPDGSHLALVAGSEQGIRIKILTPQGATISSFDLPSIGYGMPSWTPDGKWVIAFDRRYLQAFKFDIANPSHRYPVAAKLWNGIAIRPNGTFARHKDEPGIWRIDGVVKLISAKFPEDYENAIVIVRDEILIPDYQRRDAARILGQPVTGGPDRLIAYTPNAYDQPFDFTANPATGEIVYVAEVLPDTNIDLLKLVNE